jgi:hypothetical protein
MQKLFSKKTSRFAHIDLLRFCREPAWMRAQCKVGRQLRRDFSVILPAL